MNIEMSSRPRTMEYNSSTTHKGSNKRGLPDQTRTPTAAASASPRHHHDYNTTAGIEAEEEPADFLP